MNFEFSDESKALQQEARRFLDERSPPAAVRRALEGDALYDREVWRGIAGLGWLGAVMPEAYGGAGMGYEALAVIAQELGRSLAPVPFASSACLATEAILRAGSETQKREHLPALASGARIGTFALAEGPGNPDLRRIGATVTAGRLTGAKWPVPDGDIADLAIVVAREAGGGPSLFLVDLGDAARVRRTPLRSIDPTRDQARLEFDGAAAEPLGAAGRGWGAVQRLLDRAAILCAFEQVGGAEACLEMARAYALERYAFGRPIGSFQAIKHKLVEIYIATELARSNAYYGIWACGADAPELPVAAATARVAASEAFELAARENIQTHGGMGFTWEADCHLYYRRAKLLALTLGSAPWWKDRLIAGLEARNEG